MSEFKVYDKAAWHIDGGEDQAEVVKFFTELYTTVSIRLSAFVIDAFKLCANFCGSVICHNT